MDKKILLSFQTTNRSGEPSVLVFYEDGTYAPCDHGPKKELSLWKLENDKLYFKHPDMREFKAPWSDDEKRTVIMTDAIKAELYLKSLFELKD